MNSSSSRRSLSRASSASSGPKTPIIRRRKPRQTSTKTIPNTTNDSHVPSTSNLKNSQSKSKTVKWTSSDNTDKSNNVASYDASANQQHETTRNYSSSMFNDLSDDDMTPSLMIDSLSLSQSTNNVNNNISQTTAISYDPTVKDVEGNIDNVINDNEHTTANLQTEQSLVDDTDLMSKFEVCDNGCVYKCKLCETKIKKQKRSTSNLRRHVGRRHGQTMFMYKSQVTEIQSESSNISPGLKEKLDEKHINAIIVDSRPFGDFSREGMLEFLDVAVSGYKPLHRTTVRQRLHELYIKHMQNLRETLAKISDIALTTDIWKDSRNRYFISLTGHFYDKKLKLISLTLGFRLIRGRHTAPRIAKFIKRELVALNIEEKIRSITTDNAPNVVKAIFDLGIGTHHSCMAHNLNLIVQSTLFPPKKKKKSSSSTPTSLLVVGDQTSTGESSDDETMSVGTISTSEEKHGDILHEIQQKSYVNMSHSSSDDDDISSSSEDEELIDDIPSNIYTDPTLLRVRLLIKQVRELVGTVHRSGPLSEYVQQQITEKNLCGEVRIKQLNFIT